MNKELSDRAWRVLPTEFRESVKSDYLHLSSGKCREDMFSLGMMAKLQHLFGVHNLTSDAEEEEMLTCSNLACCRNGEGYLKKGQCDKIQCPNRSKRLPDEETDDDSKVPEPNCKHFKNGKCAHPAVFHIENGKLVKGADCDVSSCEDVEYGPKPAGPKFKEGDKAILKGFVCTIIGIVYNRGAFAGYIIESPKLYGDITVPESKLEPYTEPKEKPSNSTELKSQEADKHFDNILKDGFSKERRLNIAAMAMAGILSKGELADPDEVTDMALIYADELIEKCEEGGTL